MMSTDANSSTNSVESAYFRSVLGSYCSGITVVTAHTDDQLIGMACKSSASPPTRRSSTRSELSGRRFEVKGALCLIVITACRGSRRARTVRPIRPNTVCCSANQP
ncbi:MAG: hypothetical protein JWR34_3667 [Mycobacterium sp.]|nr:hypothetical protein [Mycobacterium sp.]